MVGMYNSKNDEQKHFFPHPLSQNECDHEAQHSLYDIHYEIYTNCHNYYGGGGGNMYRLRDIHATGKVSVNRVVLAGDGSLMNCGSFLAYYTSVVKVCSMPSCAVK